MDLERDIVLNNLSFSYTTLPILEEVNLLVRHGEFASIVGPNGGGKTTLLKLILGLLTPDRGEIQVMGESPEKMRRHMGYMPQYAHLDMNFPASVMDVALMGRLGKFTFRYSRADRKMAMEALDRVDMVDFKTHGFHQLSGGQKQRVLIARALCSQPRLLLLDEPTANVDHETEENLFTILKELNRDMTILLVSHDLGFVSQYVKSVICVNRQVVIHPTTHLQGQLINEIYNGDYKMVRHDHRCSEGGHLHD
ncbi:MAG: ABC transporter ATP-binding protein [Desulfobacterales bacterium]|nr:ABC transporter ATP-binding protein [Desulfobacterales bacterium]